MAEIWHRGPLGSQESPKKKRTRLENFWTLFGAISRDVIFQYKTPETRFSKDFQKSFSTISLKRAERVDN